MGWCLLNQRTGSLFKYGKVIPDSSLGGLAKYQQIINGIEKVLEKHEVGAIVIEQPNTSRNMKTTRVLCGLHGVIKYFLWLRYEMEPVEINTKTAKKYVTGNGNADKKEMVKAINKKYGKDFKFSNSQNKEKTDDDICDAIGVALTYKENNNGKTT